MRHSKFDFVEFVPTDSNEENALPTVTINPAVGTIHFSHDLIRDHNLRGRPIKFLTDTSKNALAWKYITPDGDFSALKNIRMLPREKLSIRTLSIRPILKQFKKLPLSLKKLPVREYSNSVMDGLVYYVILDEKRNE